MAIIRIVLFVIFLLILWAVVSLPTFIARRRGLSKTTTAVVRLLAIAGVVLCGVTVAIMAIQHPAGDMSTRDRIDETTRWVLTGSALFFVLWIVSLILSCIYPKDSAGSLQK